jgi:flagellar biosynthesis/type III secretory pathway chaperone
MLPTKDKKNISQILSLLRELKEVVISENNQLENLSFDNLTNLTTRKEELLLEIEQYSDFLKNLKNNPIHTKERSDIASLVKSLEQLSIENKNLLSMAITVNNKILSNIAKIAKKTVKKQSCYEEKGFYSTAIKQVSVPFVCVNYNI